MKKVITYGTYDLLHYGHVRLLERAKALGDYLIVGVTADDFDKTRGKINVKQSLMERVEAVRSTGVADEIIIEEYEGQKIDDIRRYDVDIFTVGSDWLGKFDYLNNYCKVIYLDRTEGVSSSEIRAQENFTKLGLVGDVTLVKKYYNESLYVNCVCVKAVYTQNRDIADFVENNNIEVADDFDTLLTEVDAVYIASIPTMHYEQVKKAINAGKHVLCESPISLREEECKELFDLSRNKNVILMEAIKTAYSTAYNRLLLLLKGGKIGDILSVDATCTSLLNVAVNSTNNLWNSINGWGPTALLPIFQIIGINYNNKNIVSWIEEPDSNFDLFTKIDFTYSNAVATLKVGKGVKSEGELIISGTKGYVYVPAPWWKTDYFEVRFENSEQNKRYFYQLDGEGIRYTIVALMKSIETGKTNTYIDEKISEKIASIIESFYSRKDMQIISCNNHE